MENIKDKAEALSESVTEYIQTYYKLSVMNAADKVTGVASSALTAIVVIFLSLFGILFLSIALGLWLGSLLASNALGFLLVAGIYLIAMAIILALRKKVIFPMFRNIIIDKLYE